MLMEAKEDGAQNCGSGVAHGSASEPWWWCLKSWCLLVAVQQGSHGVLGVREVVWSL